VDSVVRRTASSGRGRQPTSAELRRRAQRIRIVITDCDGVLTDAGVYYSARGAVMRRFSVRDGMGVARLRDAGIDALIVSQEESADIRLRAAKLRMRRVYLGARDKMRALSDIQRAGALETTEIAFIGDDVNDLDLMEHISSTGLTAVPADAMAPLMSVAHYQCPHGGGHGAFRDFAEWILSLRLPLKGQRT
jgi:3-deoxy-D-manno-octulosonate 8-phosphate phosphatase (KDO 8-P phosphatase)